MRLVLATKNPGKVIEFERILAEFGAKDLEVVGLNRDRKSTRLNSSH